MEAGQRPRLCSAPACPPGTEPSQAGSPFSPANLGRSRAGRSALIVR